MSRALSRGPKVRWRVSVDLALKSRAVDGFDAAQRAVIAKLAPQLRNAAIAAARAVEKISSNRARSRQLGLLAQDEPAWTAEATYREPLTALASVVRVAARCQFDLGSDLCGAIGHLRTVVTQLVADECLVDLIEAEVLAEISCACVAEYYYAAQQRLSRPDVLIARS